MVKVERSAGAMLVERLEQWIAAFISFPNRDAALVCAVYAIGTWVHLSFFSWPFLAITASVKGAGKTTLLKVLKFVVRNGSVETAIRPGTLLGTIAEYEQKITMLVDEAEDQSSEAKGFMSQVINTAYQADGLIRRKAGKVLHEYKTYVPFVMALIGDPNSTVRSRSIVVTLHRADAARDFYPDEAMPEGLDFQAEICKVLGYDVRTGKIDGVIKPRRPDFLQTRDREIWGSIFGLADFLKLDQEQIERLEAFASDNAGEKVAPKRASFAVESEDEAVNSQFSIKALTDLLAVLQDASKGVKESRRRFVALSSADACEKMKEIRTAPWRTLRGKGLDQYALSALVSRFGITTDQIARKVNGVETNLMGYKLVKVEAAYKAMQAARAASQVVR